MLSIYISIVSIYVEIEHIYVHFLPHICARFGHICATYMCRKPTYMCAHICAIKHIYARGGVQHISTKIDIYVQHICVENQHI